MNRMYSAEYYRRDLRAYAFGANMSYDTCQGACMADMECGVTYWSDNVCYVAELEDIRNGSCCTLFTNKSYIETNFGNVRGKKPVNWSWKPTKFNDAVNKNEEQKTASRKII